MTHRERNQRLEQYENAPGLLQEALENFPSTMWKYNPAPKKWSIHEIVIHLADSEIQSYVRLRMILAEPGTLIPNHDEHQWSVALHYVENDLGEALVAC